jgi:hypothetical protein
VSVVAARQIESIDLARANLERIDSESQGTIIQANKKIRALCPITITEFNLL